MKKYIVLFVVFWFTMASYAHQPDASTTVLVEKENNVWVLQISASLTAFQQEINTHFSETPYKTPEEFREMVLQHIKNNLYMHFNGNGHIELSKGMVKLGHETKVIFEVLDIPSDLQSVEVTNTIFKDIYKNQSSLILLKENFEKNKFVLNNANDHSVFLTVSDNKFVEMTVNNANFFSSNLVFVLLGFLVIGILIIKILKQRRNHSNLS